MPSFTAFPPPLTSVSSSVDPFLFLPLFLFKVQKHRPCSIFKFGLESCPSSDRANTGSMHSSSAYLSKYSLVSGSMKSAPICSYCRSVSCRFLYLYCICISLHVLSLYPYFSCPLFFFSSSTKFLDFWLSHLQSCSGKFSSLTSHLILVAVRVRNCDLSSSQMCWKHITVPPPLCVSRSPPASLCSRSCSSCCSLSAC